MLEAVARIPSASPLPFAAPRQFEGATDEMLYLIGRPPLAEDLGFFMSQVVNGDQLDVREMADAWRDANDVVTALQTDEAGQADEPVLEELHPDLLPARDRLLRHEGFRRSLEVVPLMVKMVRLDRLIVPQKHINLSTVEHISAELRDRIDPQSVFDICMPIDHPRDPVRCLRSINDSFVFVSPSHDLRFLDAALFDPSRMGDDAARGMVSSVVGIMVGYSCNCLTAMLVQNRLILINGTHRAFALLQMGFTHAPCVIQCVSRPEELALLAPRDLVRNQGEFLSSPAADPPQGLSRSAAAPESPRVPADAPSESPSPAYELGCIATRV
jgi:hypothetical protein